MFKKILTKEQAQELDEELCVKGYLTWLKDWQPDYTQKEQAYWHGYMNGQVDSGKMPPSITQIMLAADIVSKKVGN